MFSLVLAAVPFLKRWWPIALAAVVIIAGITTVYLRGVNSGRSGEQVKAVEREKEVQIQLNDANTNASDARLETQELIRNQTEELENVTDQSTRAADPADALRRKRGCVILRQQGRDTSSIPACR